MGAQARGFPTRRAAMKSWEQRERALSVLSKEIGYIRKPHGDRLRVALAFPNTYWVGMSNLGFQTVYRLFNDQDHIVCERVFLPPKQELAELIASADRARDARIANAGARVRRVRVLRLLRVGLRERPHHAAPRRHAALRRRAHRAPSAGRHRRRRDVRQPRAARAVCRRHRGRRGRSAGPRVRARLRGGDRTRRSCCACSRASAGFYIPSFYEPQYAADGRLAGSATNAAGTEAGAPVPVRKAAVKTTDALDPPATSIFTPDTEFGSRFLIEVVRGCANLCRFCWAGYNYLPVRAFPADRILQLAERRACTPIASGWSPSRSAITRRSIAFWRASSRWATRSAPPRCASTI